VVTVIAHRGWSGQFPENTMLAFREAVNLSVFGIELDVNQTRDGQIVVIHDVDVSRTTNGRDQVNYMTLAELQRLDAGQGEQVPTLREVLEEFAGQISIQVEIKVKGIEVQLAAIWEEFGARDDIYFTSFHHEFLGKLKKQCPTVRVITLELPVRDSSGNREHYLLQNLIFNARKIHAAGASLIFRYITPAIVTGFHEKQLFVQAWSVPEETTAEEILTSGVDGFTTNWPNQFLILTKGEKG